jgi:Vacuolar sorting protein 9 (VPS9) domain
MVFLGIREKFIFNTQSQLVVTRPYSNAIRELEKI